MSMVQWLDQHYAHLATRPADCTIESGEIIYVPAAYQHGIINTGTLHVVHYVCCLSLLSLYSMCAAAAHRVLLLPIVFCCCASCSAAAHRVLLLAAFTCRDEISPWLVCTADAVGVAFQGPWEPMENYLEREAKRKKRTTNG
jgi:hypothetical protein